MIKQELTFLKEAIDRYQQNSNRLWLRVQNQLPNHIEQVAGFIEQKPYNACAQIARATRQLKGLSVDVTETIQLTNDFLCDKAQDIVRKAEFNQNQ